MIMYKVTKGGFYSREVFRITSKHVYYVFTDNLMMQRTRIEKINTPLHRWFEKRENALAFYETLIGTKLKIP